MRTGLVAIALTVPLLAGCSDSDDMLGAPTGDLHCGDDSGNAFVDCGNGTVTDNTTLLIWLKDANCFDLQNFADATTKASGMKDGDCGLSDSSSAGTWRLPTKEEWEAVLKPECPFGSPNLPDTVGGDCWSEGQPFFGVRPSAYWSSTSGSSSNFTWIVYLHDSYFIPDAKTDLHYVWPVRDP